MAGIKLVHGNHHILGETDGYFYCYRESDGRGMESHIHSHYEIVYLVEGHCIYTIENKEYFFTPGSLVFTRPNEFHSFSFPENSAYKRHFIHIYPDYIKDYPELIEFLNSDKPMQYFPPEYVTEYGIDSCFDAMRKSKHWAEPGTRLMSLGCILHILAAMIRLSATKPVLKSDVPNRNMQKILKYIDSHYTANPSRDKIAEAMHLSPVHVSRLFRNETGMTLKNYINLRKLILAKNMIVDGEQLTLIPEKCGFENYSTFYRAFMKHIGCSPEVFRKSLR